MALAPGDPSYRWETPPAPRMAGPRPPGRGSRITMAGFLAGATVAIGYGLWALYGSGASLVTLDAAPLPRAPFSGVSGQGPAATRVATVTLDPAMNPLRAVLREGHAPVGSTRIRYRIELAGPAGVLWAREGALGSHDDEASIVRTTTSLATFEVAAAGPHEVRVRLAEGSMDGLREATIELRRNVARVDTRVTWGFGMAALACLVASLTLGRREAWPYRPADTTPRAA